jgi:hypothetical protein
MKNETSYGQLNGDYIEKDGTHSNFFNSGLGTNVGLAASKETMQQIQNYQRR